MSQYPTPATRRQTAAGACNLGYERSAYVIFAEYASELVLESAEVSELIDRRWALKSSIFQLSREAAAQLGAALSIEPNHWATALGRDLVGAATPRRVLLDDLRYCVTCLDQGTHSALFQHPAVMACPVHGQPLQMGCPHCGKPIRTSPYSIARHHLHCGHCGRGLSAQRRRASAAGDVIQIPSHRFAALRDAMQAEEPTGVAASKYRLAEQPEKIVGSARLMVLHGTHCVWPRVPVPGIRSFREEMSVSQEDTEPSANSRWNLQARAAALEVLIEIAKLIEGVGCMGEMPACLNATQISAARVDIRMPLLASAFWRTAVALSLHHCVQGELPAPTAPAPPFGSQLPHTCEAMRIVVRRQVQALFASNVLDLRWLSHTAEVAWTSVPPEAHFCPPWKTRIGAGLVELRVRARVNDKTVSRLASRYRRMFLTEVPVGESVLGAVSRSEHRSRSSV